MCYAHFSFRMRVKKLPKILALHLKRFKYMEQLQRYAKLSYRVVFPFELRLFNTVSMSSSACTKSMFLSINKGITSESKIQDKDRSIMHVNSFLHAAGGYFLESPNNYLVTRISLLLTLSSNDFPHSSYSFWSRMVFGC